MSLRFFHVIFIIVCIAMAALVGGWGLHRYVEAGSAMDLSLALSFFVLGLVLVLYGFRFFNKLKELES